MADVDVEIDASRLFVAIQDAESLPDVLGEYVQRISGNANAASAGFRTGIFHDHDTGETRGDTQPVYKGNVKRKGRSMVGLVYTGNYAAQKDNYENNTLLKSAR